MTSRGGIVPNVGQIEPERVQIFTMAAIVFNILLAMAARRDGYTNLVAIERLGAPFGEVQESIVRGIELPSARKGAFHRNSNPVPKGHSPTFQVRGQMIGPLWQVVNKDRSSRFEHTDRLVDPSKAPIQVLGHSQFVLGRAIAVVLAEVEWRVRENGVDRVVAKGRKKRQAVSLVHYSSLRAECRLHRGFVGGDYRV